MKRLVMDIDGTLTYLSPGTSYSEVKPRLDMIEKVKEYHRQGFEIILYTSRNMNTYNKSIGEITAFTVPVIIEWLNKYCVPYNELHIGKPWCGKEGFYVDDKAIRPSEFKEMSLEEVHQLLEQES